MKITNKVKKEIAKILGKKIKDIKFDDVFLERAGWVFTGMVDEDLEFKTKLSCNCGRNSLGKEVRFKLKNPLSTKAQYSCGNKDLLYVCWGTGELPLVNAVMKGDINTAITIMQAIIGRNE
jgi:hypothetical protein